MSNVQLRLSGQVSICLKSQLSLLKILSLIFSGSLLSQTTFNSYLNSLMELGIFQREVPRRRRSRASNPPGSVPDLPNTIDGNEGDQDERTSANSVNSGNLTPVDNNEGPSESQGGQVAIPIPNEDAPEVALSVTDEDFQNCMLPFYMVLLLGFITCLVPFKIVVTDQGKYFVRFNIVQWIVTFLLIFMGVAYDTGLAYYRGSQVSLTKAPDEAFLVGETYMGLFLTVSVAYVIIFQRQRFVQPFTVFETRLTTNQSEIWKVMGVVTFIWLVGTGLNFALYLEWLSPQTKGGVFDNTVEVFHLPLFGANSGYVNFIFFLRAFLELFSAMRISLIHLLLWTPALGLYALVPVLKSSCLEFGKIFRPLKGTRNFRRVLLVAKMLSRACGPMTVVFFIQVIPYGVLAICGIAQKQLSWFTLVYLPLKVGHVFFAAESNANAKNLRDDIVTHKIDRSPQEIMDIEDPDLRRDALNEHREACSEFITISEKSVTLSGMDFFDLSYPFIGTMVGALTTFVLILADWLRDTGGNSAGPYNFVGNLTCSCVQCIAAVTINGTTSEFQFQPN